MIKRNCFFSFSFLFFFFLGSVYVCSTTAEQLREAFLPLEDLRDELSPIRVLHEAVTLSGIADMGPVLPQLTNLPASEHPRLKEAARALLAHDRELV